MPWLHPGVNFPGRGGVEARVAGWAARLLNRLGVKPEWLLGFSRAAIAVTMAIFAVVGDFWQRNGWQGNERSADLFLCHRFLCHPAQRPSPKADPQGPGKDRAPRRLPGAIRAARRSHRQLAYGADLASLKAKQQVSRGMLFTTLADTQRRQRLRKKVLGIIQALFGSNRSTPGGFARRASAIHAHARFATDRSEIGPCLQNEPRRPRAIWMPYSCSAYWRAEVGVRSP